MLRYNEANRDRIVEIRRRFELLMKSSSEINQTYSAIVSALVFPYMLEWLFMSETTRFYEYIYYLTPETARVHKELVPALHEAYAYKANGKSINIYDLLIKRSGHDFAKTIADGFRLMAKEDRWKELDLTEAQSVCRESISGNTDGLTKIGFDLAPTL